MFLSRLAPLLESVATALVLRGAATRLFGRASGVVAGALLAGRPVRLGMGHLDGVDIPVALATALTSWALLGAIRSPTRRRLVVLGVACAGAVLVKDTGILVALTAGAVVVWSGRHSRWHGLARLVPVAVTAWVLVLLCYLVIDPASLWPYLVVPEPFLVGLRYLVSHDTAGSPAYLVGAYWTGGQWWYWPVSLVVKIPLTTVAVLVAGPVGLAVVGRRAKVRPWSSWYSPLPSSRPSPWCPPRTSEPGTSCRWWPCGWSSPPPGSSRAARALAGVLHLPPVPVVAGLSAVLVTAAGLGLVSGVAGPSSIAWVNPPFVPGYQAASNANLDWGQDFYRLRAWSPVGTRWWPTSARASVSRTSRAPGPSSPRAAAAPPA